MYQLSSGAMTTPQELDNEAQQLENEAKSLEDIAIDLYHQQHVIPAQVNIQRAQTLRGHAGRKRDEAHALRSQVSGVSDEDFACIKKRF